MYAWVLRPLRYLRKALAAERTPRQLALGVALGMVVGLVPKGNLTAVVLLAVMMSLRVNLGAGLAAAALFSWIGGLADPVSHRIGLWLLSSDLLRPMWTAWFGLPLAAWSGLDNTVVLGSLVLGVSLFYWTYCLSLAVFERHAPMLVDRLRQRRPAGAALRAPLAAGGDEK